MSGKYEGDASSQLVSLNIKKRGDYFSEGSFAFPKSFFHHEVPR